MGQRKALVALGLLAVAAGVAFRLHRPATHTRGSSLLPTAEGYSNILPGDYVGPESCKECHEEKYNLWRAQSHSKMNRDALGDSVRGDFSNVRVPYEDGFITFARDGAAYTMTLERDGKRVRRYKVTRTVGSRFMQFYIGVEIEGPDDPTSLARTHEQKLPFGYWFRLKRWLPTSYFDPVGPETRKDGTPVYDPFANPRVHLWTQNCMLCHNTYPYVYRLALPNGLSGFAADEMLMAVPQLRGEIEKHMDLRAQDGVPGTVRDRITPDHLVTLGISCESCHLGMREHVKNEREARFVPTSPYLKLAGEAAQKATPDKENAFAVNRLCAQCHCATVTRFPDGAGTWNSREALDMIGGACRNAIKCTDCHDPHKPGGLEAQPEPDKVAVEACVKCHAKLASPAHSRHGANVTCLDCHMPRVTQGLEEVVRTHRIASPVETTMLAAGSANACNLCHLDKSVRWTAAELEKGWGRKVALPEAAAYGGSLDGPVGKAWLQGPDQSMRLVAGQAYVRSPLGPAALPDLERALDDPVAVNRMFAGFAVERVRGRSLTLDEFDATAPADVRRRQVDALLGAAVK